MSATLGKFWESFRAEASILAAALASGRTREGFDRVEALLQEHNLDFCFDLTQEEDDAVLILTPEGDRPQAESIDRLLKSRPAIPGWRFYGRRRRKPLEDVFVVLSNIYGLDLRDATFDVRKTAAGYDVIMHSPRLTGLEPEEAEGLVATFLDHAVGEDVTMSRVARTVAQASGAGPLNASECVGSLLQAD